MGKAQEARVPLNFYFYIIFKKKKKAQFQEKMFQINKAGIFTLTVLLKFLNHVFKSPLLVIWVTMWVITSKLSEAQ